MLRKRTYCILCTLLLVISFIAGCSVERKAGVSRETVERALSGEAGTETEEEKIKNAGERALPLLFEVLRERRSEWGDVIAYGIIIGMLERKTADPSAPYVREVLKDANEEQRIRVVAAEMLAWYFDSPDIQSDVIGVIANDEDEKVRATCITTLAALTIANHRYHQSDWSIDPGLRRLLVNCLRDDSAFVRTRTCEAIGNIAKIALEEHNVELQWCIDLLIEGRRDSEYEVRKEAVDALFVIESIRRKGIH